jgi:hypothetical protein
MHTIDRMTSARTIAKPNTEIPPSPYILLRSAALKSLNDALEQFSQPGEANAVNIADEPLLSFANAMVNCGS